MNAVRRQNEGIAILTALLAAAGALLLVAGSSAPPPALPGPPALAVAPPPVEPLALMPIGVEAARTANEEQPFVAPGFPVASPFHFTGDSAAISRAADCLAAAVLYEAGDDAEGQRAVAQVVINRARHPAYPKSICGVIFQGSERATGCQFTFTCDGALARRYGDPVWQRARGIALDALHGAVYRPVGLATHYHTDWVRPWWSPRLEKLARVGTHLFFRWPGYWGSPGAMTGRPNGQETAIPRLAALSPAHAAALPPDMIAVAMPVSAAAVDAAVSAVIPRGATSLGDTIILRLDSRQSADSFPALARAACGDRPYCKVMGWTNPALAPAGEDMDDAARVGMSFSYLRDPERGFQRALWNCAEFRRDNRRECMRR